MPGAATPPVVTIPWARDAVVPYITAVIPVDPPGTPGAASWKTGYPGTNMTPGGVPPSGADTNGLLFALSSFAAMLQAGQCIKFDAAAATAFGGYKVGAMLGSTTLGLFWFNLVDGNTNNPDVTPTGWLAWRPTGSLYLAATAAAGSTNNAAPTDFNASVATLDLTVTGGDATWTGLLAGSEGQRIVVTNLAASTHNFTFAANSGASLAANRFRCIADITLLPGMTAQIQYSVGAGSWIVIS